MCTKLFSLGELADPNFYSEPLEVGIEKSDELLASLQSMMMIRAVERKLADGRRDGIIGGPVHLSVGQEAVAVGVSKYLRSTDRVFGAHRSHSHLLALGSDIRKLFAEILGRDTGHSRGMGGSMHLWDQSVGFFGSVPIVAGTVPLAVGAAMASRLQSKGDIAVAYFGDGACEEGVVHESMNLAQMQKDPVLFVVENNMFASHMHMSTRQPLNSVSRLAFASDMQFRVVDGNDVLAVSKAASELISAARAGNGPGFIEAVTYRWYGHVDWREDIDVGVNRSKEDVDNWKRRDPILRLCKGMIGAGLWSEALQAQLHADVQRQIEDAWGSAIKDPFPEPTALLSRVFAS
jgi:pyruvate dehydrogenase E1 component alpha subunit